MLDRLTALNMIAWVREPGAIHVTVAAPRELRPTTAYESDRGDELDRGDLRDGARGDPELLEDLRARRRGAEAVDRDRAVDPALPALGDRPPRPRPTAAPGGRTASR